MDVRDFQEDNFNFKFAKTDKQTLQAKGERVGKIVQKKVQPLQNFMIVQHNPLEKDK